MTRRLMSGLSSVHASSTTKNDRSTDDLNVSMLKSGSWALIASTPSPGEAGAGSWLSNGSDPGWYAGWSDTGYGGGTNPAGCALRERATAMTTAIITTTMTI